MSDRGNDWGLTNPRAVRRDSILIYLETGEEEGIRSTGLNRKNKKALMNGKELNPSKKHKKGKNKPNYKT